METGPPPKARQAEAYQTPEAKGQGMKAALALAAMLALTACGDGEDEIYEQGYEEGYNDGQRDVCRELYGVAPNLKNSLDNCRGF